MGARPSCQVQLIASVSKSESHAFDCLTGLASPGVFQRGERLERGMEMLQDLHGPQSAESGPVA